MNELGTKTDADAGEKAPESKQKARRFASSWDAKEANAEAGSQADYLSNLGTAQNYNINVEHGVCVSFPRPWSSARLPSGVHHGRQLACHAWCSKRVFALPVQARIAG